MSNSFVYCIMLINLISDFQLLVFYEQQNTLLWVKTISYGRDPNNVYNLFSVELNIKQVLIILRIFDFIIIFVHSSSLLYIYHCFYSQWIFNTRLISFCWGEAKEGGVEKLHFLVYVVMKLYYLGFTEKCSSFVLFERCEELGLVERCQVLDVRKAEDRELLTVHSEALIDQLRQTDGCLDLERLEKLASNYDAVYIHPVSQLIMYGIHYSWLYQFF